VSDPENLKLVESLEGVYGESTASYGEKIFTGDGYIITAYSEIHTPLQIYNVTITPVNCTAVDIEWETNIPAKTVLRYRASTGAHTHEVMDPKTVTHHRITLGGLQEGTTYYFTLDSLQYVFKTCEQPAGGTFIDFFISVLRKILNLFA